MIKIDGKYSSANVFSDTEDWKALSQIEELCSQEFTSGANIRIMPDYHYGAGCTIGFTANLGDKVVPNLVGVDIGCGVLAMHFPNNGKIDFAGFDEFLRANVPSGFCSRTNILGNLIELDSIICYEHLTNKDRFSLQIGTLGGGNHFIEIDENDDGERFLVIHSGSRNLGKQVAEYYQAQAVRYCSDNGISVPQDLAYLEGTMRDNYLHDMRICQKYAELNRRWIGTLLMEFLDDKSELSGAIESVHNYIGDDNIIRKGAVSSLKNELLIIPINMRDGSLLCRGKGNADWNFSAPHGAGRILGRGEAKRVLSVEEFQETMEGVFSTTVGQRTLDEAPDAYKPMDEIVSNIGDTVEILQIIKPIYNFKA